MVSPVRGSGVPVVRRATRPAAHGTKVLRRSVTGLRGGSGVPGGSVRASRTVKAVPVVRRATRPAAHGTTVLRRGMGALVAADALQTASEVRAVVVGPVVTASAPAVLRSTLVFQNPWCLRTSSLHCWRLLRAASCGPWGEPTQRTWHGTWSCCNGCWSLTRSRPTSTAATPPLTRGGSRWCESPRVSPPTWRGTTRRL